jgi:hypothetical protein
MLLFNYIRKLRHLREMEARLTAKGMNRILHTNFQQIWVLPGHEGTRVLITEVAGNNLEVEFFNRLRTPDVHLTYDIKTLKQLLRYYI